MPHDASLDAAVRARAFLWLREQVDRHGDVLPWALLLRGFEHDGRRVPMLSQQGIFKPALCRLPLSIRTSADSPYEDHFEGDRLVYSYRGEDPTHRDNAGLRHAMQERTPLVYFHGVVKARYLAVWPVILVGDEPGSLRFLVQVESAALELGGAAHIVPDSAGGSPEISNGLSLCKIHHAAFDQRVLGVRPQDYRIQVREDILREIDGPMLKHGLQALHDRELHVPRSRGHKPDPERLLWQWERFHQAS